MPTTSLQIARDRLDRLRRGAVVVPDSPALFEISGSGALQCMQGLLTNDLVKPGDHSLVYGALLTPKGMIVVDEWVVRRPGSLLLIGPASGRGVALEIFRRQLPPRLAQVMDQTGEMAVAWLHGDQALGTLRFSGLGPVPEAPARVVEGGDEQAPLLIARAPLGAPFVALLAGGSEVVARAIGAFERAGGTRGDALDHEAARIFAGWPALGHEIDEKTLPQEVRFDEIEGVSYTKGCYTGQETVARLHFRGHANRELRGLRWDGDEAPTHVGIAGPDGRDVGTIRSTIMLPDCVLGLGMIRREVGPGDLVTAGGLQAEIVSLPFETHHFGE
jgi:folate-binding protein YgfZ